MCEKLNFSLKYSKTQNTKYFFLLNINESTEPYNSLKPPHEFTDLIVQPLLHEANRNTYKNFFVEMES